MKKIEEILAQFPFMDAEYDDGNYDHEASKKAIIEGVELPAFYTFDKPKPCYTIHTESTVSGLIITVSDSEDRPVGGTFGEMVEAYDYVQRELKGDVVFTGDLSVYGKDQLGGSSLMVKTTGSDGRSYTRMLFSSTDSDTEWLAKHDYLQFLQAQLRYEADPTDFLKAWSFVDKHPAFWTRHKAESNQWSTSNNGDVWVGVSSNKKGKPVIMLETGQAIEPERTSTYHDLRLDVYAATYEEAFVELAALVHKFFNYDGTEKENVEYEKSQLELDLDASLAAYREETGIDLENPSE